MNRIDSLLLAGVAATLLLLVPPAASAQVSLGSAKSFGVLGGSTVTNTGTTEIDGSLGLSPGTAVTGFPPGIVSGTFNVNDGVALKAKNDATTAYNTLAGTACDFDLTDQDLGGLTLVPGVYCFQSSAQLTGALTLDGLGNEEATFIFKIGSTLTTASGSSVNLINGASACNISWQVGTSATLGATTEFAGNLLAGASITLTTGANVSGRVFALTGAVTMDSNIVSIPAECRCVVEYGMGCAGTGGFVPELSLLNCPIAGFDVTLELTNALGGSMGLLFLGQPGGSERCGCTLLVDPGPFILPFPLDGTGGGDGTFTQVATIPADAPYRTFAIQAFVLDDGAPCGFTASNAVLITM